jgi:hypothetical protein
VLYRGQEHEQLERALAATVHSAAVLLGCHGRALVFRKCFQDILSTRAALDQEVAKFDLPAAKAALVKLRVCVVRFLGLWEGDAATTAKFSRNDAYWGGKPKLESLEFIFSDDIATQVTGLQSGAADVIVQLSVIGGEAILNNPDQFTVTAIRGAAHRQLWMNVREGTFTDVNVRTAIALAFDRQALVDTALGGKGDVGNDHPIAPVYEFFDASLAQRERDVEKAKSLLDGAGKAGSARART